MIHFSERPGFSFDKLNEKTEKKQFSLSYFLKTSENLKSQISGLINTTSPSSVWLWHALWIKQLSGNGMLKICRDVALRCLSFCQYIYLLALNYSLQYAISLCNIAGR